MNNISNRTVGIIGCIQTAFCPIFLLIEYLSYMFSIGALSDTPSNEAGGVVMLILICMGVLVIPAIALDAVPFFFMVDAVKNKRNLGKTSIWTLIVADISVVISFTIVGELKSADEFTTLFMIITAIAFIIISLLVIGKLNSTPAND